MRRIAVQGLCAVACSEDSIQYDAPAQDNDSEGGSNGFDVDKDKKVYYTAKDAIKVLWKALADDVNEIRKIASETLLSLAAQGVSTAIDAVMWNVDTVITDGIDMPGLGNDGTPEYAQWCETLGDAGKEYEALMANVKSAQESHNLHLAKQADEERRKRNALDAQLVHDAAEEEDWHYCNDVAFPQGQYLVEVLEREASDPDRKLIRQTAAHCLQAIAAGGHPEAAKAVASNYDSFFELTGIATLARQAAEHVAQVHQSDEALLPQPRPVLLSKGEAKKLEEKLLQVGNRNGRIQAAVALSEMAEQGGAARACPQSRAPNHLSAPCTRPPARAGREFITIPPVSSAILIVKIPPFPTY